MNITEITLLDGIGYCPCCQQKNKKFRLKPRLRNDTRGTNIPLWCGACKSQFIVDISALDVAVVIAEKSSFARR